MDVATAIQGAAKAKKAFDEAIEVYEYVRVNGASSDASAALLIALMKARKLGWAVEEIEKASGEVLPLNPLVEAIAVATIEEATDELVKLRAEKAELVSQLSWALQILEEDQGGPKFQEEFRRAVEVLAKVQG